MQHYYHYIAVILNMAAFLLFGGLSAVGQSPAVADTVHEFMISDSAYVEFDANFIRIIPASGVTTDWEFSWDALGYAHILHKSDGSAEG